MKQHILPFFILAILIISGCHAGRNGPVTPDLSSLNTDLISSADSGSSRVLWGLWEVQIDKSSGAIEMTPLRSAMFNANIAHFLSPPYSPTNLLTLQILPGSDLTTGYLNLDIGLGHPFPGANQYKGFDVRGIFMADGSIVSDIDSAIRYGAAESNEAHMLNPDGYTRWWNATEFSDPFPLFSYKPGAMGNDPYPSATLNPYKYFADDLTSESDVADLPPETRGVFSSDGSTHKRNYKIQFPVIGSPQYLFNYAIDASWHEPDPAGDPDYPIDSFPPGAQCQEAYHVDLDTTDTTALFESGEGSGEVVLAIEVFDWQALSNPDGVPAELTAIWVESSVLDSPLDILPLATVSPGSQTTSSVFTVTLGQEYLNLTAAGVFSVLGSVESADPTTYQPQIDGGENFIYPEGPLAAWFMGTVIVGGGASELTIIQPNGGEVWGAGSSQEILWEGGTGIDTVTLLYSKDDFVNDTNTIVMGTLNNGSYTWNPVPDDPSDTVKVRVCDAVNYDNYDDSDDYFTIGGAPLELLVPNGGEQWVIGTTQDILWTGGSGIDTVTLLYSKDDFVSDNNTIVTGIDNNGSFDWDPIPDDPSDTVLVRVCDATDLTTHDDSDDYFSITDECIFTDPPDYDSYTESDVIWATGYHFLQIDSTRIVACRFNDEGNSSFPWLAVYDDSDYTTQIDTFEVPGWSHPNRPWAFDVDSSDRIFFFMDSENTTDGGFFDTIYYVDWNGSAFNESTFNSIDISSFLDSGEEGEDIWMDSNDDLYAITTQGKVIKFDHTAGYAGTELFDLDGNSNYQQGWELDFFLAEDINAFFIYVGYGSNSSRAIHKVSYDGNVLDQKLNIFSGILSKCGTYSGGIGADGDCRLIVIDGHIMQSPNLVIIRYDYALEQKAHSTTDLPGFPSFFQPGNTVHFDSDGRIRLNAGGWWTEDGMMQTQFVFFTTPGDW